jgi:hypothetical protein
MPDQVRRDILVACINSERAARERRLRMESEAGSDQ